MATKYLGNNSLLYLLTLIKTKLGEYATTSSVTTALAKKVDVVSGKGLSTNDYTTDEKNKLADIETGANKYTLPTAAKGTLGGVTTTSTVTSATGYTAVPIISGVPYYKDTNTTYSVASEFKDGLMSKDDKAKLNDIEPNAEVNTITSVNGMTGDVNTEFVVNLSTTSGSALSGNCETEYQDIEDALTAGKRVWLKLTFTSDQIPYVILPLMTHDDGNAAYGFCGVWNQNIYIIRIDDEGSWRGTVVSCATAEDVTNMLSDYVKTSTLTTNYWTKTTIEALYYNSDDINAMLTAYAKKGETITYDGPYASLDALKTAHSTGTAGTIYLVSNSGTAPNVYNEYVWVTPTTGTAAYELIGTTAVDLSDYLKKTDLVEFTNAEVQTVWDNA